MIFLGVLTFRFREVRLEYLFCIFCCLVFCVFFCGIIKMDKIWGIEEELEIVMILKIKLGSVRW